MANTITSRYALKQYILTYLGSPFITVELTDAHLDYAINDALRQYKAYASVPNERQFIVVHLVAGQATYSIPSTVRAIIDLLGSSSSGVNTLFTIENILHSSGQLEFNNFDVVSYEIAMNYLDTMSMVMGYNTVVRFSDANDTITVYPTPDAVGTLYLEVYNSVDSTEYFDHPFVLQYARGAAMIMWANVTGKYEVDLPQGGRISVEKLRQEGQREIEEAKKDLREVWEDPPMFFTG